MAAADLLFLVSLSFSLSLSSSLYWLPFSLHLTHNPLCLPRVPGSAFASLKPQLKVTLSSHKDFLLAMRLPFHQPPFLPDTISCVRLSGRNVWWSVFCSPFIFCIDIVSIPPLPLHQSTSLHPAAVGEASVNARSVHSSRAPPDRRRLLCSAAFRFSRKCSWVTGWHGETLWHFNLHCLSFMGQGINSVHGFNKVSQ